MTLSRELNAELKDCPRRRVELHTDQESSDNDCSHSARYERNESFSHTALQKSLMIKSTIRI